MALSAPLLPRPSPHRLSSTTTNFLSCLRLYLCLSESLNLPRFLLRTIVIAPNGKGGTLLPEAAMATRKKARLALYIPLLLLLLSLAVSFHSSLVNARGESIASLEPFLVWI